MQDRPINGDIWIVASYDPDCKLVQRVHFRGATLRHGRVGAEPEWV